MEPQLRELVAIWYSLMVDHHKDRDCHFYIHADYRYSGEVVYSAEHHGYIIEDVYWERLNRREFARQAEAEEALAVFLVEHIKDEANCIRDGFSAESKAALAKLEALSP